jgi:predicted permease
VSGLRAVACRIAALFGGRTAVADADVHEEMAYHLELATAENVRRGMSPSEARRQARLASGGLTIAAEAVHDRRGLPWVEALLGDVRYAVRTLRRSPAFTVVAVLTLALGIGANTAIFSVVNAVLFRPLPYVRPDRLVNVWETKGGDVSIHSGASYPDLLDWRRERSLFASVEAYDETNVTVGSADGGDMVGGARVTSGFFTMLGVAPLYGRSFGADDDASGGTLSVILSHGFWTRQFAADPAVVGRTLTVDGTPLEIRGVLPPQFNFAPAGDADLWLPIGRSDEVRAQRANRWLKVVGRLREGVTVDRARHRMDDVMRALTVEYPETNVNRGAMVAPLRDEITAGVDRPLLVLFGAVGIVLLIASANVAGLVLTRSIERGREIALRGALGASRARLVSQLVTESIVLALAGAALGTWMAAGAVRLLVDAIPPAMFERIPSLRGASVDLTALAFTMATTVGTAVVFGLAPAVLTSRRSAAELLRSGSRAGVGRAQRRLRDGLVIAEIALTLVLLVGASLMGRSLFTLLHVDPGFVAERVATARIALAGPAYSLGARQQRFFEDLLTRVRALPGVEASGAISNLPLQGGGRTTFRVDGAATPSVAERPEATIRTVAAEYFRALRIPLVHGRHLDTRDDRPGAYAVVINASLARRLFGSRPAVGERLRFYEGPDSAWTIVGVVGDVKTGRLDEPAAPTIYYSHLQQPANRMTVVARTGGDPASLIAAIRREVRALDPNVAVYAPGTMMEQVARSPAVYSRRYPLVLLGAFAAAALLLAISGVYGVIAYAVTQRAREIAIRMALGARSGDVLALVMRRGLRVVGVGILVGTVIAFLAARALSSLLYGITTADRSAYGATWGLLLVVGALASYLPARRAMRLDPATLLRSE